MSAAKESSTTQRTKFSRPSPPFSIVVNTEYLGVSKDTVYAWVTSKGMPGHKVGRFWKFKKEDVDEWVRLGGAASSSDELEEKKD